MLQIMRNTSFLLNTKLRVYYNPEKCGQCKRWLMEKLIANRFSLLVKILELFFFWVVVVVCVRGGGGGECTKREGRGTREKETSIENRTS